MKVLLHKDFKKQYKKLQKNKQKKCMERLIMFEKDPNTQLLKNHALKGKMIQKKSINIGGDLRAIYEELENEKVAYFVKLGTHSELY